MASLIQKPLCWIHNVSKVCQIARFSAISGHASPVSRVPGLSQVADFLHFGPVLEPCFRGWGNLSLCIAEGESWLLQVVL